MTASLSAQPGRHDCRSRRGQRSFDPIRRLWLTAAVWIHAQPLDIECREIEAESARRGEGKNEDNAGVEVFYAPRVVLVPRPGKSILFGIRHESHDVVKGRGNAKPPDRTAL